MLKSTNFLNKYLKSSYIQEHITNQEELKIIDTMLNSFTKVKITILYSVVLYIFHDFKSNFVEINLLNNRLIDCFNLILKTKKAKIDIINKKLTELFLVFEDFIYGIDPRQRLLSINTNLKEFSIFTNNANIDISHYSLLAYKLKSVNSTDIKNIALYTEKIKYKYNKIVNKFIKSNDYLCIKDTNNKEKCKYSNTNIEDCDEIALPLDISNINNINIKDLVALRNKENDELLKHFPVLDPVNDIYNAQIKLQNNENNHLINTIIKKPKHFDNSVESINYDLIDNTVANDNASKIIDLDLDNFINEIPVKDSIFLETKKSVINQQILNNNVFDMPSEVIINNINDIQDNNNNNETNLITNNNQLKCILKNIRKNDNNENNLELTNSLNNNNNNNRSSIPDRNDINIVSPDINTDSKNINIDNSSNLFNLEVFNKAKTNDNTIPGYINIKKETRKFYVKSNNNESPISNSKFNRGSNPTNIIFEESVSAYDKDYLSQYNTSTNNFNRMTINHNDNKTGECDLFNRIKTFNSSQNIQEGSNINNNNLLLSKIINNNNKYNNQNKSNFYKLDENNVNDSVLDKALYGNSKNNNENVKEINSKKDIYDNFFDIINNTKDTNININIDVNDNSNNTIDNNNNKKVHNTSKNTTNQINKSNVTNNINFNFKHNSIINKKINEDVFNLININKHIRSSINESVVLVNNKGKYENAKIRGQLKIELNNLKINSKTFYIIISNKFWTNNNYIRINQIENMLPNLDNSLISNILDNQNNLSKDQLNKHFYKLYTSNKNESFNILDYNVSMQLYEPLTSFNCLSKYNQNIYKLELQAIINKDMSLKAFKSEMIVKVLFKSNLEIKKVVKTSIDNYTIENDIMIFKIKDFATKDKFLIGVMLNTEHKDSVDSVKVSYRYMNSVPSNTDLLVGFNNHLNEQNQKEIKFIENVKKCMVDISFIV